MRVAVHAIALNEEQHVDRWAASIADADMIVVGDTGSTDGTVDRLMGWPVDIFTIAVSPWRFDSARNAAWALIPSDVDVVVKLDLDETMSPGWRDALERAWSSEFRSELPARFTYDFIWSWLPDGSPDVQFRADSIVTRHGWRWRGPCHETLITDSEHDRIHIPDLRIEHHSDPEKSRASYLGLLATGVTEEPDDDRLAHYYARELYQQGDWNAARTQFMRHLALPSARWPAERAASWRYLAAMDDEPERWLLRAISEDTNRRESWVALADHYTAAGNLTGARAAAGRALSIKDQPADYITNAHVYDDEHLRALL